MSLTTLTFVAAAVLFGLVTWLRPERLGRLAPFALVARAVLLLWMSWSRELDSAGVVAVSLSVMIAIGIIEIAAVVAVANQPRSIAALVGAAGWTLGWLLHAATLLWVIGVVLGARGLGKMPDAEGYAIYASTIGGVVFAFGCARRVDPSRRRFATLLVAFYGLLAFIAVFAERRLLAAPFEIADESGWRSLRIFRDVTAATWLVALAVLLRYCERHRPADPVPRAELVS